MCVTLILLMAALATDVGRAAVTKAQLQDAADSAARYAAAGLAASSTPSATARNHALAAIADQSIDGGPLPTASVTTTVGTWDAATDTFTPTQVNPTAVQVQLAYSFNRSGTVPFFANAVGAASPTLRVTSVASTNRNQAAVQPQAAGNVWLAGMPDNTTSTNLQSNSNRFDNSGTSSNVRQRPLVVDLASLGFSPGDTISFEGLSGSSNFAAAEGNASWNVALGNASPSGVPNNSQHGMSNLRAPIGSVVAVFLNDQQPHLSPAPSCLDFGTSTQRDYAQLAPQMKQVFFVGDGKRSTGEVQMVVVPSGATRVAIGMMDAWQWNDTSGNFNFNLYGRSTIGLKK
jgi:Flp pilus assembly protein TadG